MGLGDLVVFSLPVARRRLVIVDGDQARLVDQSIINWIAQEFNSLRNVHLSARIPPPLTT